MSGYPDRTFKPQQGLTRAEVAALFSKIYEKDDCNFGYRKSRFLNKKEIVVSACFNLRESDREIISSSIKSYRDVRKSIQPMGKSCGSVFKNPKPYTAGALIDKAGLKGYSVGGATVSSQHGNFIITKNNATAQDVYKLITYIKDKIKEEFDIQLNEEVEFIGDF